MKPNVRRILEIGSVLLFVAIIAVMGIVAEQGREVGASEVENGCSAYPYPVCGCSAYPSQESYPYPYPVDCTQYLPAITVPYPGQ